MKNGEKKPEQHDWVYFGAKMSRKMKILVQQEARKERRSPSNMLRKIIEEWSQRLDGII